MIICNFCNKEYSTRDALGGHIGGHVRRGEIPKTVLSKRPRKCDICQEEFETALLCTSHKRIVHRSWEECGNQDRKKKIYLLLKRGRKCEVCLTQEWMGQPVPIEMDHIDGNPENGKQENLRLICPNCHAQTSTYRGKNVGKVQNSKRKQTLKKYYGKYR